MKRFGLAVLAVLLVLTVRPAQAEIPQIVMDRLGELHAERASHQELSDAAESAITQWRAAPSGAALGFADIAARLAYRAGRSADAIAAAEAIRQAPGVEAVLSANAQLILALEAFAASPAAEPQLAETLETAAEGNALLRARAARALAIAHMRRDEQQRAIMYWRAAEAAALEIANEQTYDVELALLGRAAAHAYEGESAEGAAAVEAVLSRLEEEMAYLVAAREISAGEQIYANAIVWRSALTIHRTEVSRNWNYIQVGAAATDAEGRPLCRGSFRLRPRPHFPVGAVFGRWSGATVLRLATDAEGRVVHAEAVAAVPPTPLFSRVSLDAAPQWRFVPEDEEAPGQSCHLQAEGLLISWRFEYD